MGEIFNLLFLNPITNLLVACYKVLEATGLPYPLGFAIIALTIVIRLILYPFAAAQIKSAQKMQRVAPHMAALKEKHKDDKKKQQEEMMRLYKEHGVNPASGCLPLIIQIPVFISLYNVLTHVVNSNSQQAIQKINDILYSPALHITKTWDTTFFGIPLAQNPTHLLSTLPIVALALPLLTGVTQFILSKMMLPQDEPKKEVQKKDQKSDDFQAIFQSQSLYIFPVMIGFFSLQFPVGLSLYWITFTLFGILQQYRLAGIGGAKSLFDKTKKLWIRN